MIGSIGLEYNYLQWNVDQVPPLPYLLFYYPNRDDMIADNKNYAPITALNLELCTAKKDFAREQQVEAVLISHDIPFTKTETYIDSEKMFLVLYESEVLINA